MKATYSLKYPRTVIKRERVKGKWKNIKKEENVFIFPIDSCVQSGFTNDPNKEIYVEFAGGEGKIFITMNFDEAMTLSRSLSVNAFWGKNLKCAATS